MEVEIMWNYELVTIDDVIELVKSRGREGWIIDENTKRVRDDILCIDVLDILEDLKEIEATDLTIDEFEAIRDNANKCDNTYNWGANISNDLEMRFGYDFAGEKVSVIAVHLAGDVRGNYTDMFAIRGWLENIYEFESVTKYVDLGDGYEALVSAFSDTCEVCDAEGNYIGEVYELELEDAKKQLQELLSE